MGSAGSMPSSPPRSDGYAKAICAAGRILTRHPRPLLARGCVQLLLRAPGRAVEIVDGSGHRQRVDTRDQMGANLLVGRYRLPPSVSARIAPGDWVIDCGANIGVITSQLAAVVGPTGRVWALEPVPGNVERLRFLEGANRLSQVKIFAVAAGSEEGVVSIGLPPPGRSGWGSITKSWDVDERAEVEVARIDDLVAREDEAGRTVRFVKIDVEGYEFEVIEGARSVLRHHRPLVYCEFNDILLRDRGRSSAQLLALFAEVGYRPDDEAEALRLENRVVNLLLLPDPADASGAS